MSVARLFRLREMGRWRDFVRHRHCNEKSVDAKQGEVTAYDEPDGAAVGGVGER